MSYRLNLGSLRGMDALTIEITVQEALRRPIGGLTPGSLVDLLALSEVEGLASGLAHPLGLFTGRMGNEIADLPPAALRLLVEELSQVDAERIPDMLRIQLLDALATSGLANREDLQAAVEGWGPSAPFPLGGSAPKVRTAPEARRNDARFAGKRVGGRGEPATKRTRRSTPTKRSLNLGGAEDPVRDRWVEQACMQRLAGVTSQGLLEAVLIAGVRHGARNEHGELGAHEVKNALGRLKERGLVRFSAGRWSHSAGSRW